MLACVLRGSTGEHLTECPRGGGSGQSLATRQETEAGDGIGGVEETTWSGQGV